jgi:hypothetical protein
VRFFARAVGFGIAVALSMPALGLPRYSVETIEAQRNSETEAIDGTQDGRVLFRSGDDEWVWNPGGTVRPILVPQLGMNPARLAPDGSAYVVWSTPELKLGRIRPDGTFEALRQARTPLYALDDIPFAVPSIAPDGRALSHVQSIDARYNLQVSWQADSVEPDLRLIRTPDAGGRMIEWDTNGLDMGVGEYESQVLDAYVPGLRMGDTIRLLDRADYSRGYAGGISESGRWIAGTLLRETSDGYKLAAVRWDHEELTFLSPLPGYQDSGTASINNHGIAVGRSHQRIEPFGLGPTIWDEQGLAHNLRDLIETDKIVHLENPLWIDARGRIVVQGYEQINGRWSAKAFFLTPIPEPATIGVVAMLGLTLRRVR